MSLILYGVGSPLAVDYEAVCDRLGLAIAGAVSNVAAPVQTTAAVPVYQSGELPESLLALPYMVPIFTPGRRRTAVEDAEQRGLRRRFILVDPTAVVARSTTIGEGTFVNCSVAIGGAGSIGAFVVINRSASIGHHARIGDYVAIGPAAALAGNVTLGRGAVIGVGAVISPSITIGDNAVVAAGAVVTGDVAANTLVGGHPARVLRSEIAGYNDVAA